MKEEALIKWLIVIGIVSFAAITISNFLFGNLLTKFSSSLVPVVLCQKDYNGSYILAQPTSYYLCNEINDIEKIVNNPQICDGYGGEQKNACLKLIEIFKNRSADCIGRAFGRNQTSVNPMDVKTSCELFNITVPSKKINSSLSIVGEAILPIIKFYKNVK